MTREVVAVTGAGGFIGRATVAALVRRGADVVGLVGPGDDKVLPPPAHRGRWAWGSIDDADLVADVLAGCRSVIHLAGPPSVGQSFASPAEFVVAHTAGTATVVQTAARVGSVQRVVLVSSAEVYGIPRRDLVAEDDPTDPQSPYATAKLAAEGVARVLARVHGLQAVAVRPFAVYGPASPAWSLVGLAVAQAMRKGGEPVVMNDLTRVRDLVYVDDVADLLVRAAITPLPDAFAGLLPVNAATGRGTSVRELAHAALAAAGRSASVEERPPRPEPTPQEIMSGARPGWSDPQRLVGSPVRAAELLGWTPLTDVETGLRALVAERQRTTP